MTKKVLYSTPEIVAPDPVPEVILCESDRTGEIAPLEDEAHDWSDMWNE